MECKGNDARPCHSRIICNWRGGPVLLLIPLSRSAIVKGERAFVFFLPLQFESRLNFFETRNCEREVYRWKDWFVPVSNYKIKLGIDCASEQRLLGLGLLFLAGITFIKNCIKARRCRFFCWRPWNFGAIQSEDSFRESWEWAATHVFPVRSPLLDAFWKSTSTTCTHVAIFFNSMAVVTLMERRGGAWMIHFILYSIPPLLMKSAKCCTCK